MERNDLLDVLIMVKSGKTTVKSAAKMIELIEKEGKSSTRKTKNYMIVSHEKANTYVSPIYTGAYLVEYFSVPKNL